MSWCRSHHWLVWLSLLLLSACRSTEDFGALRTELLERPTQFEFSITGNHSFLRGTLQRAAAEDLRDFVERDFPRAAADDAAYSVESFYRSRGFPSSKVRYELERPEGAKPKLSLSIEEGPRCTVAKVRFPGATFFSEEDLAKRIAGPTTSLLGLGELYFVERHVLAARTAVEDLYWENGFLDIEVAEPQLEFNADRTQVELTYVVREGRQYLLRAIEVLGLEGDDLLAARARAEAFLGEPYFPRLAFEVRSAASEDFTRNGYPDAQATASAKIDPDAARVDLTVEVVKGELVRISEVLIRGNVRTRESFILERIELRSGDLYDRVKQRRAFGELYSTGLFSSIDIKLSGQGATRALVVTIEEAATLSLTGEVGYGAFERARVIVGVTEENIAGTGRSLRFEGKLAQRAESLRLFLTDPWTFGKRNVLGVTTFFERRIEPSFDRKEVGVGANITRPESKYLRNVYGYEYRRSDADNVDLELPLSAIDNGNDSYISALYLTNIYDSRDSVFLPTAGSWGRLRTEFAPRELASQLTFLRIAGRFARYHPIGEDSLFAWTVQTGIIFPIQATSEIPLQERYFNGGQNTVRSFRQSELGPKAANGNPIGGETYTVLSAELRRKLRGNFTGALFVDAGNIGLQAGDYLDFADFRFAVGPGLRWLLPIGPLRLDWGVNPDPRPLEADWVLQFSVGVAF